MAQVVVMEDDAGTRVLIASVLKKDGHEVLEFSVALPEKATARP